MRRESQKMARCRRKSKEHFTSKLITSQIFKIFTDVSSYHSTF